MSIAKTILLLALAPFLLLMSCESNVTCETRLGTIKHSPNTENSIFSISEHCGVAGGVVGKSYLVRSNIISTLKQDLSQLERQNLVFRGHKGFIETHWVSDTEVLVSYDEEAEFYTRRNIVNGIEISYKKRPDDAHLKTRVLKACPAIIAQFDELFVGNERKIFQERTFKAERLGAREAYMNFVERTEAGQDYVCLIDRDMNPGWSVIVRVSEKNIAPILVIDLNTQMVLWEK